MTQYLSKRYILSHLPEPTQRYLMGTDPSTPSLHNLVTQSLLRNRLAYCQQLARVVVDTTSRSQDGRIFDCLLELFLATFPEYQLPLNSKELGIVQDLESTLTCIFLEAGKVIVMSSSDSSSMRGILKSNEKPILPAPLALPNNEASGNVPMNVASNPLKRQVSFVPSEPEIIEVPRNCDSTVPSEESEGMD